MLYSLIFNCFSLFLHPLPRGEYLKLACSIIPLWSDGNISSTVRNSYLSILPDDKADIFAASLLISYCSFSSLIVSSIVMISYYVLSKIFFLQHEELSDARLVSITNEYSFAVHFLYRFKVNIWWMIKHSLLKLSFVWNFHKKIVCWI